MNETTVARAPGKLFLLGEYAVLDGGAAVVAAVDRHVEVRLRRSTATACARISAPGHCPPFELTAGATPPPELRFACAALEIASSRLSTPSSPGCELEIRSGLEAGAGEGVKLGLGGSAAVCAAVVAALHAAAGRDVEGERDEIFAAALTAHHRAQEGVGSGADVAASVYGGLLRFARTAAEALPRVAPLSPPPGWSLHIGWSGRAAATAPLVRRYLALEERGARQEFLAASRASVDAFAAGLAAGRVDAAAVNGNGEALERLARDCGMPLLTPELERIVALARRAGAGAKVSGAGGGDCAIALTDDPEVAARLAAAWRAAGVRTIDLRLEARGVSVGQA